MEEQGRGEKLKYSYVRMKLMIHPIFMEQDLSMQFQEHSKLKYNIGNTSRTNFSLKSLVKCIHIPSHSTFSSSCY